MNSARLAATLASDATGAERMMRNMRGTPWAARNASTFSGLPSARLLSAHDAPVTSASSVSILSEVSCSSACVPPLARIAALLSGWFRAITLSASVTATISAESLPAESRRTSSGATPACSASSWLPGWSSKARLSDASAARVTATFAAGPRELCTSTDTTTCSIACLQRVWRT